MNLDYRVPDINKGNIIYTGKQRGYINIDYGGMIKIDYPEDWKKIPKGLMSLFRWLDTDSIAAFRFGYLQHGGPVAELVFSCLRGRYGLNGFRGIEGVAYTPLVVELEGLSSVKELSLVEDYLSWKELRSKLPYGELTRNMASSDLKQWQSECEDHLGTLMSDFWKVLKADEYYYKKHLVAAIYNSSLNQLIEALLNLQEVYLAKSEYIKVFGLLQFYERLLEVYSICLCDDEVAEHVEKSKQKVSKYISPKDKEDLRSISDLWNIFRYIWCLDDLENGTLMKEI